MERFLMAVNVIMTIVLMLVIMAGLLGKIPARLVYIAGSAISGVCLLAGLLRMDGFTILMQAIAVTGWTAGLYVRKIAARRRAAAGTD
jgi:hypothetical protein